LALSFCHWILFRVLLVAHRRPLDFFVPVDEFYDGSDFGRILPDGAQLHDELVAPIRYTELRSFKGVHLRVKTYGSADYAQVYIRQ